MKNKAYAWLLSIAGVILLLLLASLLMKPRLTGRYYSREAGLISYIEFNKNSMVKFEILGMRTTSLKYKIRDNAVYVNVPTKGQTIFTIIDSGTIKGVSPGFEGVFVRQSPIRRRKP
ncbi:MAG: hypothetical protein PHF84_01540 [bacterium]|nr:hypothetical protein [bacterium]